MTINKTMDGSKLTIAIEGRLDTSTAPKFQEEFVGAIGSADEIVLDFAGLAYVSSAGLRVLLMGQKAAKAKGAEMCVCNVSEEIMEVLDMTGFSDMLTFA